MATLKFAREWSERLGTRQEVVRVEWSEQPRTWLVSGQGDLKQGKEGVRRPGTRQGSGKDGLEQGKGVGGVA